MAFSEKRTNRVILSDALELFKLSLQGIAQTSKWLDRQSFAKASEAAKAAATTLISIDEYLHTSSYNPDVEYIDGELRERLVAFSFMASCNAPMHLVWPA